MLSGWFGHWLRLAVRRSDYAVQACCRLGRVGGRQILTNEPGREKHREFCMCIHKLAWCFRPCHFVWLIEGLLLHEVRAIISPGDEECQRSIGSGA